MENTFKIMVVDDNVVNLKLISDLLELEGFDVYRCEDAESVIESLARIHPDLILTDIALPGMDGLQLTRQLKSNDKTKDIKIVALTAFAMNGDKEKIIQAGCDGYIAKPIDTRKFRQQISQYFLK